MSSVRPHTHYLPQSSFKLHLVKQGTADTGFHKIYTKCWSDAVGQAAYWRKWIGGISGRDPSSAKFF